MIKNKRNIIKLNNINIMKFFHETKTDANKIDTGNGKSTE